MDYFNKIRIKFAAESKNAVAVRRKKPLYYGMQVNVSGPMFLRINRGKSYVLENDTVFFTCPNVFFEYGAMDKTKGRDTVYVCFDGEGVSDYIESGLLPLDLENPLIRLSFPNTFYRSLSQLVEAVRCSLVSQQRLVWMFEGLLLQLHEQRDAKSNIPKHYCQLFRHLLAQIQLNPEENYAFEGYARKFSLSNIYFRQLFKTFIGSPPQQYVIECRLNKAANLLVMTDVHVKEIAFRTGFNSEFYFSRLFKKKFGLSPKEFRRA